MNNLPLDGLEDPGCYEALSPPSAYLLHKLPWAWRCARGTGTPCPEHQTGRKHPGSFFFVFCGPHAPRIYIIWSDESKFEVTVGDERKKVIRNKNEAFHTDCLIRKVKFPASLMIWGCMSAQGVGGMQFVDGSINAARYQNLLEESLLPSIPPLKHQDSFIFQQDGASCHTARTTKTWLLAKSIPTIEWPSNSPDLSPIETLWWKMKKVLRKNPSRSKMCSVGCNHASSH
ncbi:hypothetical protein ABMA28_003295 [Loxostege sticticalis]|uniref:Tc1-like transposase DDE domain-containing protein n=1 Tax=Loxostege sticticalis TaxID=481309 RepID=A0ABD0SVN1_LOXSC